MIDRASPLLDTALLAGFRYACRPGCGLCCYAEPLVTSAERSALIRLIPSVEFVARGRDEFLRSASEGGACLLLRDCRCEGHARRPSLCREFPLTVHVGTRLQATVVLSCPGVDLEGLDGYSGPAGATPGIGFESELAAVRQRVVPAVERRLEESGRRRHRVERALAEEGRWEEDTEVRRRLCSALPETTESDFPADDPPSAEDGLDRLPLVFLDLPAPAAFSLGLGGWEILELRPSGGIDRSLGIVPPPTQRPVVVGDAGRLLVGYLRYWLERDLLFGAVHRAMLEGGAGTVSEWIAAELRQIAALVLSRAQVLATVQRGSPVPLRRVDIEQGIRATDQDLLDRPTWGTRL